MGLNLYCKKDPQFAKWFASIALFTLLTACGGGGGGSTGSTGAGSGGSSSATPQKLEIVGSSTSVIENSVIGLTLTNPNLTDVPVTWTIVPAIGALSGASNTGVTYNAPPSGVITGTNLVTVTARTASGLSASLLLTINSSVILTGIAVNAAGTIYVTNTGDHTILQISPVGIVTILAGAARNSGSTDGIGAAARFNQPHGIAVDTSGMIYVADYGNHTIRKITPDGTVTTLAGSAGSFGSTDGNSTAARFNFPYGIGVDATGSLYVADTGNHVIRKISPAGLVSTLVTNLYVNEIAVDATGTVYASYLSYPLIYKINLAGGAGTIPLLGLGFGLSDLSGIAIGVDGTLYMADFDNNKIVKLSPTGALSSLAGRGATTGGNTDGIGNLAQFNSPQGLAVDASGTVYVADTGNGSIRKITPQGVVTTVAHIGN